jgi:hypothetical protein
MFNCFKLLYSLEALISLSKLEEEMVGRAEQMWLSNTSLTTMRASLLSLTGFLP